MRGQVLFDTRITEERVRLMAEANFFSMFFGLDGASDEMRRSLKKPGSVAQVTAAMDVYHRGGNGGLCFGMPVGIPGETEADYRDAERFVDHALTLEGTIDTITVLPYLFTLTAQDPDLARKNHGARRGVMWRADMPGGGRPGRKPKRMMRLFDHVKGRVPVTSPLPPYLVLPAMLPNEDPARIEAWMERYGREFDQIKPPPDGAEQVKHPPPALLVPELVRIEHAFHVGPRRDGWVMDGFGRHSSDTEQAGLVALFSHAARARRPRS